MKDKIKSLLVIFLNLILIAICVLLLLSFIFSPNIDDFIFGQLEPIVSLFKQLGEEFGARVILCLLDLLAMYFFSQYALKHYKKLGGNYRQ